MCMSISIRSYAAHTYVHVCTHVYTRACAHVHAHFYMHVCVYFYTHTYESTTSVQKLMSLGLHRSRIFRKIDKAMQNRFFLRSGLSNDMRFA